MENSFDLGKTVENAITDSIKKRGVVNILIAGRTGVGKAL